MADSSFSMFVCDPWESYVLQLQADSDRQIAEMEREEDLEHEHILAAEHVEDVCDGVATDADWPSYADSFAIEIYPEIVEHWDGLVEPRSEEEDQS